ncbi:phage tail assembly chaperone [Pseudomonas sp. MWU349]|uniref:phage tail assembly chaperone n=1 Tax=Pseudomonas sp. MWU349 TaxID=2802572 RepID=UPI001FF0CBFE|nr:phage tail assembly chaperone [Pseudomonas sp. MWU349]
MQADTPIDRTIYHAHPETGEFLGEGEARLDPIEDSFLLIPAHATQAKPPAASGHQAAVLQAGEWLLKPDYRGLVYSTADGSAVQHFDLGDLPEGFTHLVPPGEDFAWSDKGWVLDEEARSIRLADAERVWRNGEVDNVKWLRERHRDEQDLQKTTTLSDAQFTELLSYLQALRDWPQSDVFPDVAERPAAPPWIADQTQ